MTHPKSALKFGWAYEDAESSVLALDDLLRRHGVNLVSGTPFEKQLLEALTLVERKRTKPPRAEDEDLRPSYRALIGVHELAAQLLAVQNHPHFDQLVPHLELLNIGAAVQNAPSRGQDDATNKIFELIIGASAIQFASDICMDSPTHATGHNPDVLFSFGGRRWAIACKMLYGDTSQGFCDRLIDGLDQIDRSPAEVGLVAFNLKNVLPHDEIWPLAPLDGVNGAPLTTAAFDHQDTPLRILSDYTLALGDRLVEYLPTDYLTTIFAGRKSIPGFLLWGASASAVVINGAPSACSVRFPNFQQVGPLSDSDRKVVECVTWGLFADSPMRPPCPC